MLNFLSSQGSHSIELKHQESGLPTTAENLVKNSNIKRGPFSTLPDTAVVKTSLDLNEFSKGNDEKISKPMDLEAGHDSKSDHHPTASPLHSNDLRSRHVQIHLEMAKDGE